MFQNIVNGLTGNLQNGSNGLKIKGTVVLMKKNVLEFNDLNATISDNLHELLGQGVGFQLISGDKTDKGGRGMVGEVAYLQDWNAAMPTISAGESVYSITFTWIESMGIPAAFIVKNFHDEEFFLKTLTLEDFPGIGNGRIHFVCDSWVYPANKYNYDRVFFSNQSYLPSDTPEALRKYREDELVNLRGNGTGERQEWDRVYDYAFYNDLGAPDLLPSLARPVLGGSKDYPYPRRGRTGRRHTLTDPNSESRLILLSLDIYVPRDERFGHVKMSDFLENAIKAVVQSLLPLLEGLCNGTPNEFVTFQEVLNMYQGGIQLPFSPVVDAIKNLIPIEMISDIISTDGQRLLKYPLPQVIQADKWAWSTDEEFARQMLAGLNPVIIRSLQVFPPVSKLDPQAYGNQNSTITAEHIEKNLQGLTVDEALKNNRLFILDHHDMLMPYVNRINTTTTKLYATRTLLFLKEDGTLTPLAIELSLPHPEGEKYGAVSQVFTPAHEGVEGSVWLLAKAFAAVNDSGVHQLISHWLNTHASIEPFVIATNRHLSVLHPIHKLLNPHYRDTMNINALARQALVNAGGLIESTVFPAKYSMELSSMVYKDWVFTEQGLPADLIKRGMAVQDPSQPQNLRLLIKDYPFAVDGLEIWSAIETWVNDYCSIYYHTDAAIQADSELQSWWTELREKGHSDKKDEPWWPKMQTFNDLTQTCTTIIWVASALHAAINFGQYSYSGYHPNHPTASRRFMPSPGSTEYAELASNPDKVFLQTITSQLQTLLGVSLIEILSKHTSDEVYLGQRDTLEWTADSAALEAFDKFGKKLVEIEKKIIEMNNDEKLKNRLGPAKVPYTLLYPNTSDYSGVGGLTGRGIPNSISI
ncbi:putative linoleate 9S-lipoxygenase 5 [Tasmannia lanceolata]|uniref:putative linoleate 9S-lipoxygenase 5 n=1 Tax=Tasmannia lanceolata TaxID=3420 RepID=UPI004062A7B4